MIFNKPRYQPVAVVLLSLLFLAFDAEKNHTVTIAATGDTMLDSWAELVISDSGYAYPFRYLSPYFKKADIVFTNLEAPFCNTGKPFDKKFTFQVKPDLIKVLSAGRINLVSLGNNHSMDYGFSCLQQTMELLRKHQINYAGVGSNLTEARQAVIFNVGGQKIGFLSYNLTFPEEFWASDTSAGTCFPYEEFVFDDVEALNDSCDVVMVSCHWGEELRENPKDYQILLAHQLIDRGADLILGHHPHVVQGIERYKQKWIAYSLGNFVFGSYSESARESMILKVTINAQGVMFAEIVPIMVYNKEVDFQPLPLDGEKKVAFFDKITRLSLELNDMPIGITSDGKIIVLAE